jgi:hypothetical protein
MLSLSGSRVRVVAFATAAVLGVACGRPVAPIARQRRQSTTSATSTTSTTSKVVRLVLETGVPSRPPTVELVVHSGAHEVALRGALYTGDWSTRTRGPHFPVPWPSPTTIVGGYDPSIALGTPFVPDFVVAKAFAQIAIGSGAPSARPIATFGCDRFTEPRCEVERTGSGLRIRGLGRNILAGTYFTVFCQWHRPLMPESAVPERGGSNAPNDLTASWLFRLDTKGQPGASRP